ncbi:MAG: EamA family transporter [Actinomycetota bacterium]|nr:EamA family transporter [Actinomycetota bacterium]
MTDRRAATLSALLVVAGTALFGTVGTARVLGPAIPSPSIAAARLGASALLLAAIALLAGRWPAMRRAWRHPWVLLAGAGQAGFQVCFLAAVEDIGVATGTLVAIGCTPIVAGLATRQVTSTWLAATAVSVFGLVLLVGGDAGGVDLWGLAEALGASVSYATYIVATRHLVASGVAGLGVLAAIFVVSGTALAPLLVLTDPGALWTRAGLATALYLAVVPTVLAYWLFNAGLHGVSASTAATLGLTEPVVAAVLGVLVVGERLGPTGVAGAALVLAGLTLLVTRQRAEQ